MRGLAYVFINYHQAARFGHIGWGFSLDEADRFYFGATDHLLRHSKWNLVELAKYMKVAPGKDTDWWGQVGSLEDMLISMRQGHHIRYHAYKVIPASEAHPEEAQATAEAMKLGGWHVLLNNCIHHTYTVLSDYGAGTLLPNPNLPVQHRIPRQWFAAVPFTKQEL